MRTLGPARLRIKTPAPRTPQPVVSPIRESQIAKQLPSQNCGKQTGFTGFLNIRLKVENLEKSCKSCLLSLFQKAREV
jgi:hypothetical protein